MVSQAFPACLDKRATLATLVNLDFLEPQARKEMMEHLASLVSKDSLVSQDKMDYLACLEKKETLDTLVDLDKMDYQVYLDRKEILVYPDFLDHQVKIRLRKT